MSPEKIGRYQVVGVAGSGGFATVYEGRDPRLDAKVAIKVLADNWANDPEIRRRFRQEAVLIRRMQTEHGVPGLVEVFDIDEMPSGQPFFVMGWAGGGTLAARAGGKAWPAAQVRPVILALTQSLGHLHARGLVHRDIKPQNILLRSQPDAAAETGVLVPRGARLVLGDFGLAKDLAADASTLSFVGGTERYMAPEQLVFGGPVDHRADIFAATAMLSELLTGRGQQQVGPALAAVVATGTAHDPQQRFASMADWQTAFLAAIDESPGPSPQATVRLPTIRDIPSDEVAANSPSGEAETVAPSLASEPASAPQPGPPLPTPEPATARQPSPPLHVASVETSTGSATGSRPPAWIAVSAVLALAALLIVFLLSRGGPEIVGPTSVESGTTATYALEEGEASSWVDPSGQIVQGAMLEVTARLPGALTISAIVDGQEVRKTITVEPSANGPTILGPTVVGRGQQGTYEADVPAGQTFFWIHPTRGRISDEQVSVVQGQDSFTIGLIAIDSQGIERGDQMLVVSE